MKYSKYEVNSEDTYTAYQGDSEYGFGLGVVSDYALLVSAVWTMTHLT